MLDALLADFLLFLGCLFKEVTDGCKEASTGRALLALVKQVTAQDMKQELARKHTFAINFCLVVINCFCKSSPAFY